MHALSSAAPEGLRENEASARAAVASRSPMDLLQPVTADARYQFVVAGYRTSGGLRTGADVLRQMRDVYSQPLSVLARWTIQREIVSFAWNSEHFVPMFQFQVPSMTLRPGVRAIVCELAPAFDEWEITVWFAQPNCWLPGTAAPADYIDSDPLAVLHAARADHFIATG